MSRASYSRPAPCLGAPTRIDALGEWRSDRFAPGRDVAMDRYYYLRARLTINLRGVDLYGQLEQILPHQIEYVDGRLPGTDGVLSGYQRYYLGLYWPFLD